MFPVYTTRARIDVRPGVVDLSRNRCWFFADWKEEELKEAFLKNDGLGVMVKPDITPMRLFVDTQKCKSIEVMVSCVELFNGSGSMKLSPALTRPASTSSDGILGCLNLKNIGIQYLTRDRSF